MMLPDAAEAPHAAFACQHAILILRAAYACYHVTLIITLRLRAAADDAITIEIRVLMCC